MPFSKFDRESQPLSSFGLKKKEYFHTKALWASSNGLHIEKADQAR